MVNNLINLRNKLCDAINLSWNNIDSKILREDAEGKEKLLFLLKQLDFPKQLKLLFHASQHNFETSKFHKFCDNISDTVSIIQTGFNRTVAAYTPLKWTSANRCVCDPLRHTFLLQLDLKEKMALNVGHQSSAIYDHKDCGSTFGGGCDIQISDKCHQNNNSRSNFPYSYNFGTKYQKGHQKSYESLSGVKNGLTFKVLEYEVYQLIK